MERIYLILTEVWKSFDETYGSITGQKLQE